MSRILKASSVVSALGAGGRRSNPIAPTKNETEVPRTERSGFRQRAPAPLTARVQHEASFENRLPRRTILPLRRFTPNRLKQCICGVRFCSRRALRDLDRPRRSSPELQSGLILIVHKDTLPDPGI